MRAPDIHTPLERAVLAAGIAAASRLLVAVSGGADSVALLDALVRLSYREDCRWELSVGHVNHGLRGRESDDDERFVRRLAEGLGLPVDVRRTEVAALAAARGQSVEVAARQERYRLLWGVVERRGADFLLTAHTEDDQAETLLLNLLRGAGPIGLGAIHAVSGRLLRPLLSVSRETVLDHVQTRGLAYRLDSSNLDPARTRNRIRHDLIPTLRRTNPAVTRILARSAAIAQTDADFIGREAEDALHALHLEVNDQDATADLFVWRALHPALRRAVLRHLVARVLGSPRDVTAGHVATMESLLLRSGSSSRLEHQLPYRLTLLVDGSRFGLTRKLAPPAPAPAPAELQIPGTLQLSVGTLSADALDVADTEEVLRLRTVCGPYHALCDADSLGLTLTVRSRRPGGRIRPVGLKGTRKVQDILVDDRVPEAQRDRIVILENHGRIVWIPGHALDERAALRPETTAVVHLWYVPVETPPSARIFRHFQP
jgi:tRNA(Ile)-lysidine synthase